jgi:2-desacetyl-2-hydroxyethyl bacteriochlorophyllide A dehydrogenase
VSERLVSFRAPGEVVVVEYEERRPGPGEVRVQTIYSGISAGTELSAYRGTNPYVTKGWDAERRLFAEGATFTYPLDDWGYEQVGEVVQAGDGVAHLRPGDLVWGSWGHRSSAVLAERAVADRVLDELPPLCGVFARIGAVALNAILDADVHVGETVAVFGQGVPGLVATQLARLSGAEVLAVDRLARRLDLALSFGAHAVDASAVDVGETIKALTDGRGADVTIDLTGSAAALHEAIRGAAYASRVVVAGFLQGGAEPLRLGEEFHHNRIELVSSQIGAVRPELSRRWDVLRLERTVLDLRRRGRLELEPLVTRIEPVERAPELFRLLDERPGEDVQVVLEFSVRGGAAQS